MRRYGEVMNARGSTVIAGLLLVAAGLTGCSGSTPSPEPSPSASESTSSPAETETPTPAASSTPTAAPVAIPDDCRAILSDEVLAQLDGVPLNDPAVGVGGKQSDGSLECMWRDPRADTTALYTVISYADRGPALDMLNQLADDEGYTCFTPDDGTRCEKTWQNEMYPVTDGRTLFWRDGVLIDTAYSNLAPTGYTASIVAHLFD